MVQIWIYDHCDNLPSSGWTLVVLPTWVCRYLSTVNTDKGLVSLVCPPVDLQRPYSSALVAL